MTDQHMNGAPPSPPTLDQQLDQMLFPMVNCMCRGATGSFMGIPPTKILESLCRNFGRVVGMSYGMGDLGPLLIERSKCKKAFIEAVDSIKPQPKLEPQQPMTKVP